MRRLCTILLYAPESGLTPLAQDYARVSRDNNYLPIALKRAKWDRAKRSALYWIGPPSTCNNICAQTSH